MEITPEEWITVRDTVKRLESSFFGNGKPGIEARLREYVDQRDNHKEAGAQQDLMDLRNHTDSLHEENRRRNDRWEEKVEKWFEKFGDRQSKMEKIGYVGIGILIALQTFGILKK